MSSALKKVKATMRKEVKVARSEVALAAILRNGGGKHKHKLDKRGKDARRHFSREEW